MSIPYPWRKPPPPCRRARPQPENDESTPVCGWFDSSHDLQAGLQVREHVGLDALAGETPLATWLALHQSTWRAAPQA